MPSLNKQLLGINFFFNSKKLSQSLRSLGDYVYGYYLQGEHAPFYVGKGSRNRVLDHWKKALTGNSAHSQYEKIRLATSHQAPVIKILAYNLEKTKRSDVYSVVERTLQSTFGIQHVVDKQLGSDRLVEQPAALIQKRNDAKRHPVLSLEAAYCRGVGAPIALQDLVQKCDGDVLLVGLSKTYHPSYGQTQLLEMARMWWNLDKLGAKKSQSLRTSKKSFLLAWSSKVPENSGKPTIVGCWEISAGTFKQSEQWSRYECEAKGSAVLSQKILGLQLVGTGKNYFGPRIGLIKP